MRRLMIAITLLLLLGTSLAVGLLAADWPFWQRALRWEQAQWPRDLPGAHVAIEGAGRADASGAGSAGLTPAKVPGAAEARLLQALDTLPDADVLLVVSGEHLLLERYAPGFDATTPIPSRELVRVLPGLLYGIVLGQGRIAGLDAPVGSLLGEWRHDHRGGITARQLLWNLGGLESPPFAPWNPLHRRARLASGPDFASAALSFRQRYPAGSHFEESPANPQLVGLLLERATGIPVATTLQAKLWRPMGGGPARALLDRSAGRMSLHCCFAAGAGDWLRLGMLLANDGRDTASGVPVLPAGWVAQLSQPSPVHPGYGLGLRVAGAGGATILQLSGTGRRVWVVPQQRVVVVRFTDRNEAEQGIDAAVLAALRTM